MGKIIVFSAILLTAIAARADIVWPTPSKDFAQGKPATEFLQPTVSGKPMSGAFGDVRNNGYRFHEGIDIKPISRNRRGEPLDDIYAAIDGKIVLINKIAGNSGYGRYVVMTHPSCDVGVYTLYAHLSEIDPNISVGSTVKAGTRLGKMGRSASYSIGRAQAHLHFEIGLMLSDRFDKWYTDSKRYRQKNFFGNYNGINLMGFDPLDFYNKAKAGEVNDGFRGHIQSLPVAFVARIYTRRTPDFVKKYPKLVSNDGQKCGWDISFTWFGMPTKFERIKNPRAGAKNGDVEIIKYNPAEMKHKCRRMIELDKKGNVVIRNELKDQLNRIFP